MQEIVDSYKKGEFREAFGAGTAAVIAPIAELFYEGETIYPASQEKWEISNWLKKELIDIRYGAVADRHHWMYKVC
jgi:branched-chain amino acid aminotransferase